MQARLSHARYLALLKLSTAVLDTRPFGGGVTTLEAIAMGTPRATRHTVPVPNRSASITVRYSARFARMRCTAGYLAHTARYCEYPRYPVGIHAVAKLSGTYSFDSKPSPPLLTALLRVHRLFTLGGLTRAGTPVVTLPSSALAGRLTLAMHRVMRTDQLLVAATVDEYVRIAARLGRSVCCSCGWEQLATDCRLVTTKD
jgi:hypothetical protein